MISHNVPKKHIPSHSHRESAKADADALIFLRTRAKEFTLFFNSGKEFTKDYRLDAKVSNEYGCITSHSYVGDSVSECAQSIVAAARRETSRAYPERTSRGKGEVK